MLFYEIVETAQAILVTYILTDGSAQTVSYIVGVTSAWLKNLR
ncbi:cell division protein FtsL [Rothia dentocariosa]|uniref:Cell division protein FtsL n=1 Tax=Rothia dentocariosa TaxID=2047 RepID=A0AAE5KMQ8_9MICC|nr:cell division protein FtsL [Rothia dentocariosa]